MQKSKMLLGRELKNSKGGIIPFQPGMSLLNASGDVDSGSLGYQYAIQTTTQIRAKVIAQKFYKVPIADFFPVIPGVGTWMEDIRTNLTYDVAGPFESGIINTAAGPSQIAQVDVAVAPKIAKIITWAKGYQYSTPEVQKALASTNWDVVSSKLEALKKNWDLGLQRVGFLGMKSDPDGVPGLLTNPDITVDTTTIQENIATMDATEFATLVSLIMGVYAANSNFTAMPNMFVIPLSDYLGLATPVSPSFPMVSKLTYLLDAFKAVSGNANFQIKGLAYGNAAQNAGFVSVGGKNRYALYNNEVDTLAMDVPVDFNLTPAGTANNFQWQGIGCAQFTGCIVYRPAEVMYFDHN